MEPDGRQWWGLPHREILSGLVVAFAMIPAAIDFSGSATGSTALLMTGLVERADAAGQGMGLQFLPARDRVNRIPMATWWA